ncbi:unnamed protein product [Arctia plantaginis]|uniref:Uncharacterized protein n=1 Tax=Arctia plantaginis TaxID=874455 RepID=A0A8S0ZK23_ARCPL|nr:unnamed protein product [Arctia plantaginis]
MRELYIKYRLYYADAQILMVHQRTGSKCRQQFPINAFTLFALLLCAILALVSGIPYESQDVAPAELVVDDLLEGAESRGHGYHGPKYHGLGRGGYHHGHHGHGH